MRRPRPTPQQLAWQRAGLLLNLRPDRRGRIDDADDERPPALQPQPPSGDASKFDPDRA
jgi:hypothetical protein